MDFEVITREAYFILGLFPGAPIGNVKKAYRHLAKIYHPDVNPSISKADDRFKLIVEAYGFLTEGGPLKKCPLLVEVTKAHSTDNRRGLIYSNYGFDIKESDLIKKSLERAGIEYSVKTEVGPIEKWRFSTRYEEIWVKPQDYSKAKRAMEGYRAAGFRKKTIGFIITTLGGLISIIGVALSISVAVKYEFLVYIGLIISLLSWAFRSRDA